MAVIYAAKALSIVFQHNDLIADDAVLALAPPTAGAGFETPFSRQATPTGQTEPGSF